MHQTLRYRPEASHRSLDITVRPDPDTSKHRQKVAKCWAGFKPRTPIPQTTAGRSITVTIPAEPVIDLQKDGERTE